MLEHEVKKGYLVRRKQGPSNNWIGIIVDVARDSANILWLGKSFTENSHLRCIKQKILYSTDLDQFGARSYSKAFILSSSIVFFSVYNAERHNNLIPDGAIQRLNSYYAGLKLQNSQQSLDLKKPEQKEKTSNDTTNAPKKFIVLETSQLNALTREEADKLLRKASIQQPGKTFTLAQMVLHSKYPIDPLIVKA